MEFCAHKDWSHLHWLDDMLTDIETLSSSTPATFSAKGRAHEVHASVHTTKALKHNTEVNEQLGREVWTPNSHRIQKEMEMLYKSLTAGLHLTQARISFWRRLANLRHMQSR